MNKKSVSIVISCYNEEANLKRGVIGEMMDFLAPQKFTWEVVICNDGSTDNSFELLKSLTKNLSNFRIYDLPHGGKPSGIWGGIQRAKYPIVLFTDMDQSTPLSELPKLLDCFDQDYDVAIGSRGSSREGNSLVRKIGSAVFLSVRRLILLPNIVDTQCGFKAMKTNVAKKVFPLLQFFKDKKPKLGWKVTAYDVELLFITRKFGYKIKEVPVLWKNEDTSTTKGEVNARYRKESVEMAKQITRVFLNNLEGKYDLPSKSKN